MVEVRSVTPLPCWVRIRNACVSPDDPRRPRSAAQVKRAEEELIWIERNKIIYLRHALLRDAAYSMQLQERPRELHALAGWAIEQVHASNLAVMSPDLAFHYEKSAIYDAPSST